MTVNEAAEKMGVTRQRVSQLVSEGRLKHKWDKGKLTILSTKRTPPRKKVEDVETSDS